MPCKTNWIEECKQKEGGGESSDRLLAKNSTESRQVIDSEGNRKGLPEEKASV
jgi:hypothetical protein